MSAVGSKKYPFFLFKYQGRFQVTRLMKFGFLLGAEDRWSHGQFYALLRDYSYQPVLEDSALVNLYSKGSILLEVGFSKTEKLTFLGIDK